MTNDNPKSCCCGAETMINMDLYEFKCGKCGKTCKIKPSPEPKCDPVNVNNGDYRPLDEPSCEHDDVTRWRQNYSDDPSDFCAVGKKIKPTCPFCKPVEPSVEALDHTHPDYKAVLKLVNKHGFDIRSDEIAHQITKDFLKWHLQALRNERNSQ